MKKWIVSMKKADFKNIAAKYHIDQVTARLIRNRDVTEDADINMYLNGTLSDLYSPILMKDMEKAADLLLIKIAEQKTIRIIGDYDIDGVMSTYILLTGLKRLGAVVDERIPDRIKDGYGLNDAFVTEAHNDNIDTLLTCDNGIAAYEQIKHAKDLGMTVIVTDHHEVPFDPELMTQIIPPADAVVDPKQASCGYPFKELCGAGIAWKLIQVLFEKSGVPTSEFENLVEFAAIATVGDIVELKSENRIIVKEGLKRLSKTSNPGLNALIRLNNLDPAAIDTYKIGFVIGPCLNASGRLETAQKALSLLISSDDDESLTLASELINLNQSRKDMTEEYAKRAVEIVETTSVKNDRVLVVYLPDCHESLAGIIAGRLRERFNKPSFVLTDSENAVKGSGRSIEEFSMFEEMSKCKDLFIKFGGHPLAAGLSINLENVDVFRKTINDNCVLTDDDLIRKLRLDMVMPLSYISEGLVCDIEKIRPFGKGNEKPLFAQKGVKVIRPIIVGKNGNAVKMTVSDKDSFYIDAIYFGDALSFLDYVKSRDTVSIAYYPSINEYRGRKTLQIIISEYM